ncbi:hypothetical protein V4V35_24265 [Bacillus infantis]|uniref:hypothetical protein n=1 Tax=Bacillus infantis TaxID=324767 RepID=UPI002FBEFBE6
MILKIEKLSKTINHKGADIIKKKPLAKFNLFFFLAVSLSFGIYAYTVSENWLIDFQEQKYNLLFFCLLFLCCLGIAVIDGTAGRYEGERVSGKAVWAGIRIVAVFMLLMAAGVILRLL